MKKVLFVIGWFRNGGVARRSSILANEMASRGLDVTILLTKGDASENRFRIHDKVKVISLDEYINKAKGAGFPRNKIYSLNRYFWKLKYRINCAIINQLYSRDTDKKPKELLREKHIRNSFEMRCFVNKLKPDDIIAFGIDYFMRAYFASRKVRPEMIFAERVAPESAESDTAEEALRAETVIHADHIVFQTKDEMEHCLYSAAERTGVVIPNPVDSALPERYCGIRSRVIVNFCRVAHQKNLKLLIDAFSMLVKDHPDCTLKIYGNTVCEEEKRIADDLKDYISRSGLDGKAEILPPRGDIHEAVIDCAMFVSSSDFEGLSNSMIEAMAIGLPVVCTDCDGGGASMMIEDHVNGILVPKNDPASLYRAMGEVLDDRALSDKLSGNAVKVRETLSASSVTARWICLL